MAFHESRALLLTITVRAFVRCRTTMPSATFCCGIEAPCDARSYDSVTHNRSPEVSSTAFRTQPPDLQRVPLMDMDFVVSGQLVRHRMPLMLGTKKRRMHLRMRPAEESHYPRMPRFELPKLPIFGKIEAILPPPTPNHCARVAPY